MFLWRKKKETLSSQIVLVSSKANSWSFLGWSVVSTTFGFWMLDELFFVCLGMFLFFFSGLFLVYFESNSWLVGCCDATGWLEAAR